MVRWQALKINSQAPTTLRRCVEVLRTRSMSVSNRNIRPVSPCVAYKIIV